MASVQNGRILRLLIAIGAVVLTIFIYASYYSNTSMGLPNHLRVLPVVSSSSSSISEKYFNYANNLDNRDEVGGSRDLKYNSNTIVKIRNIDSKLNNLTDNLKYSHQSSSGSTGNTADRSKISDAAQISNERQPNMYINTSLVVPESESLFLPTSNLEAFILNADKILKNMTSFPSSMPPVQSGLQDQNLAVYTKDNKAILKLSSPKSSNSKPSLTSPQSSIAQPPSALIPANRLKPSSVQAIIDPTQGIPTRQIYEYGHLDVNPQLCPDEGESIKLLIIITSAQSHQEARMSIRQTWGHYGTRRDVAIAFILGRTNNQTLENILNQENYMYGDLIRGHFIDSYNNLTLKTISALEWVDQHCPLAKFVLKTDDDMFINVPKLMAFIDKHQKDKRVIYGRLAKKWKPIRNKKSKYYVSNVQFAATIFPSFTTGPAYVMTADVIHDLYTKALEQTYLKLEDVFTTGIVAQQLGIKRIHVNEFLNRRIAFNPCNIRKTISVHMIKSNEQFDLWKKLLDQSTKCK